MDKKAKKRIELLRKKVQDLQPRLAGAKQQMDDPHEVEQFEQYTSRTVEQSLLLPIHHHKQLF